MGNEKKTYILLIATIFIILLSGCGKPSGEKAESMTVFTSFRDVPGVTMEEIVAIEALQRQNVPFVYGMIPSTEAFMKEDGEVGGYTALLCEWLSSLFGIPFRAELYEWGELLEKLDSGEVDFSGELTPSDERRKTYYMSDPIAERTITVMRLEGSAEPSKIVLSRPVRYAMLEGVVYMNDIAEALEKGSYEIILANDFDTIHRMLVDGEADAFIDENVVEAAFDDYGGVHAEDFLPLIFSPVSLTTKNPALKAVISVVTKAIENGAIYYLNGQYRLGYRDYKKHRFILQLSNEEKEYLLNNTVIPITNTYYNYPIGSYNFAEEKWEGISVDVLDEIEKLTGLSFEVVNSTNAVLTDLMPMVEDGRAYLMPSLLYSKEREGRFIWPKNALLTYSYILMSKGNYPKVDIQEIPYARVGLVRATAMTEAFYAWFPNAVNAREYASFGDALLALDRAEIDLLMYSRMALYAVGHDYAFSDYKVNFSFNHYIQSTFGFNKDQTILCAIFDKALSQIDTDAIAEQWLSRTTDYQSRLLRMQRPWLIGAVVVLALILVVLVIMYLLGRKKSKTIAEQASLLFAANTRIETMISNLPGMLFRCRYEPPVYPYTFASEGSKELTGYSPEELIKGISFSDLVHPDDTIPIDKQAKETLPLGKQFDASFRFLMKDGSVKWVWERSRVIEYKADGTPFMLEGYYTDITERRQLEAAEMASHAKTSFLANMSHEMRTPMNVVVGLTDLMLEDDDVADNVRDNLKKISTAGNTLLGLINDVLDFSKIEAGRLELVPVQYDVPSLLNDIITLNMIRVEEKPITFVLEIDASLPYNLYGDDLRVKQIINNLLSNAFKYTQRGTVTLKMDCSPDKLHLSGENNEDGVLLSICISDTGIGIREEDLKKLFTSYSQVDTKANRRIEGTGLGLSITKMLVEHMDGEISVESEFGKGSTFSFYIRQGFVSEKVIGKETAENLSSFHYQEKKKSASERLVRPNLSYASVLVVDDMQTNLDVAAGMLKKYKMQVDCVQSGEEAIDRIRAEEPVYDAVFMDHMMPVMDGVEATEKIRGIGTKYAMTIPIIALTANAIAGNEQMFLNKDFQAFLPKPINIIKLDAVVQRWVRDKTRE